MAEAGDVSVCMRPLLSYYGGKQILSKDICRALYQSPNWGADAHYIEPFFGGGAVFFAKEPQRLETINDLNDSLVTFYRVVQQPKGWVKLRELLDGTLYSRSDFNRALSILRGDEGKASPVLVAWAVFVRLSMSFGSGWGRTFSYAVRGDNNRAQAFRGHLERVNEEYCARLRNVTIECRDALWVIGTRDQENALFYLDPPYTGAFQDYGDCVFSDERLYRLLRVLADLQGRFLLSDYMSPLVERFAEDCGWRVLAREVCCRTFDSSERVQGSSSRVECLVGNYGFDIDGWEVKMAGERK